MSRVAVAASVRAQSSEVRGALTTFFFQAEDGIRGGTVTGVQTCALPIWSVMPWTPCRRTSSAILKASSTEVDRKSVVYGKSVDLGGRGIIKKKKQFVAGRHRVLRSHIE